MSAEPVQQSTAKSEAQAALCAVLAAHDYRPQMLAWAAGGKVGLPAWSCLRCGAARPPLTDAQRMSNLRRFMAEEATNAE
jgi:hypothetical protein